MSNLSGSILGRSIIGEIKPLTFDSTEIFFDSTQISWDATYIALGVTLSVRIQPEGYSFGNAYTIGTLIGIGNLKGIINGTSTILFSVPLILKGTLYGKATVTGFLGKKKRENAVETCPIFINYTEKTYSVKYENHIHSVEYNQIYYSVNYNCKSFSHEKV